MKSSARSIPCSNDTVPLMPPEKQLMYDSARSQAANVNVEDEADDHLKIGSLLYSFISLKDLPDATFPGMLRELLNHALPAGHESRADAPGPSQGARSSSKSRLRKMMAAQRDIHGGFRLNVDAQVAEEQLVEVLKKVISSSLKVCEASLIIGVRTSKPILEPCRSGRSGTDPFRPPAKCPPRARADEWGTGNSGDAGAEAALFREPPRHGRRQ